MKQRDKKIAEELLSTERTYVEQLLVIQTVFEDPMKKSCDSSQPLLTSKNAAIIFSNLGEIVKLNKELLIRLKKRVETDEWIEMNYCLGDIFLKIVPFLKLYSVYVANYENAMSTIMEQRKQNVPFSNFLKECYQMPECKSLPFETYLLTPVQRIPRYRLLFQDLLKHTDSEHPDYTNLQKAFTVIDEVASYVNRTIKDQENTEKLLTIQKSFGGLQDNLIAPGRKLIKVGILMKVCRKSNKPRIFYLFSDMLLYGSINPVTSMTPYSNHRIIKIENIKASGKDDTDTIQNSFFIISSAKSFQVFADTPELKESWLKDINETAEMRRKNQSTLANDPTKPKQQLNDWRETFLAPVWIPDSEAKNCMVCSSEFSVMKRRHHCRYCGKVICGSCCPKRNIAWLSDEPIRICDICLPSVSNPPIQEDAFKNRFLEIQENAIALNIENNFSDSSEGSDEEPPTPSRLSTLKSSLSAAKFSFSSSRNSTLEGSERPDKHERSSSKKEIGSHRSRRKASDGSLANLEVIPDIPEQEGDIPNESQQVLFTPKNISRRRSLSCPSELEREVVKRDPKISYSEHLDSFRRTIFQPSTMYTPTDEWKVEKSGYLHRKGVVNTPKRWVVAMSQSGHSIPTVMGKIWYYKNQQDSTPLGVIDLRDSIKIDTHKTGNDFKIVTSSKVHHFQADSAKERDDWIFVLQKVVDNLALSRSAFKYVSQESLDPSVSKDSILKQGYLTKQGGAYKTWKQRWFTLTPSTISYRKSNQDKDVIDEIPLTQVEAVEDGFAKIGNANSFALITKNRTYLMIAESPQDRDDWLIILRKTLNLTTNSNVAQHSRRAYSVNQ